jgi:hypothetical protein
MTRPRSFEEFWPYYVGEHRHPLTRTLHLVGTHLGIAVLVLGLLHSRWWLLAALPAGYALAWIGHFFVEHNRPATFTYPLWSLRGDLRMLRLAWTGRLDREVRRLTEAPSQPDTGK